MPLLCMVWSLDESEVSGALEKLRRELATAMQLDNYSTWQLDALRKAADELTQPATSAQGVKYRAPKKNLSFRQALQLYAMTIALVKMETKWNGKTDNPPPDMADFTNRLKRQLPLKIPDGGMAALLLYRAMDNDAPLTKVEIEERADVVVMKKQGLRFEVQQFPVYLTADQKEWNPSWIEPRDEAKDTTLMARKYEHDWTRFDGPFLWYRPDQLNGEVVYRATVTVHPSEVVIEAERTILSRGAVKRVERPPDYDPSKMTAFTPGTDTPATPFAGGRNEARN